MKINVIAELRKLGLDVEGVKEKGKDWFRTFMTKLKRKHKKNKTRLTELSQLEKAVIGFIFRTPDF